MSQPEQFKKEVTIKCMNDFCPNMVTTLIGPGSNLKGVYCDTCRREARRLYNRLSYWKNVEASRKRKRVNSAKYYLKKLKDR